MLVDCKTMNAKYKFLLGGFKHANMVFAIFHREIFIVYSSFADFLQITDTKNFLVVENITAIWIGFINVE